jgi:hypothetical protein
VARAVDEQTRHDVVVKQLAASPGSAHYSVERARFLRAARLRIAHPVVVNAVDSGEENGELYAVFPHVPGRELDVYTACRGGRLAAPLAVRVIAPLADALAVAHANGVVHRDVKPANVLITDAGGVRLIDFGICRVTREPTLTTSAGVLGTPSFMAPEQALGPASVDGRADMYALAALLYFLLTGRPPLQSASPETVLHALQHQVPVQVGRLVPTVPAALDSVCMRGLAKRPEHRFPNMPEFAQALRSACPTEPATVFCPSCGQAAAHDSAFCASCGAALGDCLPVGPRCLACGAPVGSGGACATCRRPFSPHGHRLEFVTGALMGGVFLIPEGEYAVGRQELLPRDRHISRAHLWVSCVDGSVQFQNASAANPTHIGGRAFSGWCMLAAGVEVDVARNRAVYYTNP